MGQPATEIHSDSRDSIPVIGLIGGVGSGKSALAHWVSQHLTTVIVDGDVAGHRALERSDVKRLIQSRFGNEVFDTQHNIRRDRLGELVFGHDEHHRRAKRDLEEIVHPVIRGDLQEQVAIARDSGDAEVILLDAAMLLDADWSDICKAIVFVDTPIEQRQSRVVGRGWTSADLKRREENQLSLEEKRAAADFVIDNSGRLESAGRQFLEILKQFTTQSGK